MTSSSINNNLSKKSNNNKDKIESEVGILSILEKSYYNTDIPEENFQITNNLLNQETKNNELNKNNITLFNALYNSLINKDHKSFLFCIQQKNEILIEETVRQMNNDCLDKFIEKSLDIFQSNSFYTKQILPWMKKILVLKKIEILSKKNVENLAKIQMYIKDKIKCFNNLCLLKEKINKINKIFSPSPGGITENFLKDKNSKEKKDLNNNKPIIFEPLLTYYESEDEDETKENKIKKNKMEIIGFEEMEKEISEENNEEMEEEKEKEESDEDDFDEEISNMDIEEKDIIKNKKNINKEIIDLDEDEDEDEENKDDIEEDEDDE